MAHVKFMNRYLAVTSGSSCIFSTHCQHTSEPSWFEETKGEKGSVQECGLESHFEKFGLVVAVPYPLANQEVEE